MKFIKEHFELIPPLPSPQKSPIRLVLKRINTQEVSQQSSPARVSPFT